ncbi:MAG: hypothetical protein ACRDJK_05270, partial [Actinomycetota bacterium]
LGECDHFSAELSKGLGRQINARQLHLWIDSGQQDLTETVEQLVQTVSARYGGVTPLEHFEAVERAVDEGWTELTKVTVWSPWNAIRLMLSPDFARERGRPAVDGALWGWETGTQALLQRLHELYIRRGDGETEAALARAAVHVASRQQAEIGLLPLPDPQNGASRCARLLASALEPHAVALL